MKAQHWIALAVLALFAWMAFGSYTIAQNAGNVPGTDTSSPPDTSGSSGNGSAD